MTLKNISTLLAMVFVAARLNAADEVASPSGGGKKLLVFVLAGQSNMQGHSDVSTLAYLPKPAYVPTKEEWAVMTGGLVREIRLKSEASIRDELLKDPANAKLPKAEFGALVQKALNAEVEKARNERYENFKQRQTDPVRAARDRELAAIFTPNLTDQKVLDTIAATKNMRNARELANAWQTRLNLPVGKHTFIAAYGGVNRDVEPGLATGPLSTGYGAGPSAIGPEYAFGIMLEKSLNQPILIIKTAWGGKSLHYDFRPPSAGPFELNASQKEQVQQWQAKKAAWDKYIADGGTPAVMEQKQKDIKSFDTQKRKLQDEIRKLSKEEQSVQKQKIADLSAKIKELNQSLIAPPGKAPAYDKAGFYWNEMIGFVHKVLADPKAYHPEYDPKAGFEVAGALWFQGFNDQFSPEFYGNYSNNMVHFIQDLRQEVKQPKMPFVIGVLGTDAFPAGAMANNVSKAQRAAATTPELAGTVAAVESWPLTTPEVGLWRTPKAGGKEAKSSQEWPLYGSNLGYHYDGSGRFFIRFGDECATAMLNLMGKK